MIYLKTAQLVLYFIWGLLRAGGPYSGLDLDFEGKEG